MWHFVPAGRQIGDPYGERVRSTGGLLKFGVAGGFEPPLPGAVVVEAGGAKPSAHGIRQGTPETDKKPGRLSRPGYEIHFQ